MLNQAQFDQVFPFHFTLDAQLRINHCGPSLAHACRDLADDCTLTERFEVQYPITASASLDVSWVRSQQDQLILLRHRASTLLLRGQFVPVTSSELLAFIGSPWLTSASQLEQFGLMMDDFAVHDPMVDMLQLAQSQFVSLDDTRRLNEKLREQRVKLRAANEILEARNAEMEKASLRLRLQEAEARKLALVAARTTNGVVVTDALGRIDWINEGFTRISGYTIDEVRGKKPGEFLQGPATNRVAVAEIGKLLGAGLGFQRQLLNYHKNGRPYFVEIEVQPIVDEQGRLTNFMAIENDVSARVCDDLRRTLRDSISRILMDDESLQSGLVRSLAAITCSLGSDVGILWDEAAPASGSTRLVQRQAWQRGDAPFEQFIVESQRFSFRNGEGLPGRVWQSASYAEIDDIAQDRNFPRAAIAVNAGLVSAFAFPIKINGQVVGVMEFLGRQPRFPDAELPEFLMALGAQIGLFLDRVRTRASLKQQHDFAQQVMSLMGQGIAVTGPDRRIEYCNTAFATLIGRAQSEIVGRTPFEFLSRENLGRFPKDWWLQASRQRMAFETHLQRADGTDTLVHIISVPRMRDGVSRGHIATITDLSDREKIERSLREAKATAEQANQAKGYFLATMSHEIRTPMNAVVGMTDLLRGTELNSQQTEYVEMVQTSAESLLGIIDEILDFSKIESNTLELEECDFDLIAMIEGAMEMLALRAHAKKLELNAIIDHAVPRMIKGDSTRIRQVLVNLLGNAIKFTAEGEVLLRVQREEDRNGTPRLRFTISDTGIGIPASQHESIFEPFVQADAATTRRFGGTGLGLAISRRLVKQFGGELRLESEPARGSSFTFSLPLREAADIGGIDAADILCDMRVLLVSDHPALRESLACYAQRLSLRLTTAVQVSDAMGKIQAGSEANDPFKAVLVDTASLPAEATSRLIAQLAAAHHSTRANVVALTLTNQAELPHPAINASASGLTKPLKITSLRSCLLETVRPYKDRALSVSDAGSNPSSEPRNANIRILVADDHDNNRRYAQLLLKTLGYQADFVTNGREAVAAVRAKNYDVILMDCQMPVMDGYTATRGIRKIEAARPGPFSKSRIIAMTADAMADNRIKCLDAGMDEFITKPVRRGEIEAALENASVKLADKPSTPPAVPLAAAEGALDRVTLEAVQKLGEGGAEVLRELIAIYAGSVDQNLARLSKLTRDRIGADLGDCAHAFGGSAACFGGQQVRSVSLALERAARQQDWAETEARLAELHRACAELETELRATQHWPAGTS